MARVRTTFALDKMPADLLELLPQELQAQYPTTADEAFAQAAKEINLRLEEGEALSAGRDYTHVDSFDWYDRSFHQGESYLWEDEDAWYVSVGIVNYL